ncbi:MAG: DUF2218 domain-containing protein [Pseudomonadota bacterium]
MDKVAYFPTDRAQHYVKSLCQHFSRRVEARWTDTEGWVQFPFGRCDMQASASGLNLTASATDAAGLGQVVEVVTSHLDRYAFRENPQLDWRALPAPGRQFEQTKD